MNRRSARQELPSIEALRMFGLGVLAPGGTFIALAAVLLIVLR